MSTMQRSQTPGDPVAELVTATQEFIAARERMMRLVLAVAQAHSDPAAPGPAQTPAKRGGRKAAIERTQRTKLPGQMQYWRKCVCKACGQTIGTRMMSDTAYPVNHKDPKTDSRCKGVFEPALPVAAPTVA